MKPAWLPSSNQVLQQLVIAGVIAGVFYLVRRELAKQPQA